MNISQLLSHFILAGISIQVTQLIPAKSHDSGSIKILPHGSAFARSVKPIVNCCHISISKRILFFTLRCVICHTILEYLGGKFIRHLYSLPLIRQRPDTINLVIYITCLYQITSGKSHFIFKLIDIVFSACCIYFLGRKVLIFYYFLSCIFRRSRSSQITQSLKYRSEPS